MEGDVNEVSLTSLSCQSGKIVQQPSRTFYSPRYNWSICISINNVDVGYILQYTAVKVCHQDLRLLLGTSWPKLEAESRYDQSRHG